MANLLFLFCCCLEKKTWMHSHWIVSCSVCCLCSIYFRFQLVFAFLKLICMIHFHLFPWLYNWRKIFFVLFMILILWFAVCFIVCQRLEETKVWCIYLTFRVLFFRFHSVLNFSIYSIVFFFGFHCKLFCLQNL